MTQIVRLDPADPDAARAFYEVREAARVADEPFTSPLSRQMARNWVTEGWTADPAVTWYVPGAEPGTADGWYRLELPDLENRDRAGLSLGVHPSRRRAGLGTALLQHAAEQASAEGRTVLASGVPRGSAGEAFALRAGVTFGIEDVRRLHDLHAIPAGLLASLRETAEKAAAGYSLVSWIGPVPGDHLEQVATVINALNDAPHDAGVEPDLWDGARVDERWNGPGPRFGFRAYAVAAVHDATGEMAAITEIVVHPETPEWANQAFTAVTRAHRGHKLGLLVKVAMADTLLAAEPGLRWIETWNAASNQYMIAVNEMLGYQVSGPPGVSVELPVAKLTGQAGG
ncbi:MAG TPA: GNAT family N-acetyltransferase [Trebonia sp.]